MEDKDIFVFDVGGTYIRGARYSAEARELSQIQKIGTERFNIFDQEDATDNLLDVMNSLSCAIFGRTTPKNPN